MRAIFLSRKTSKDNTNIIEVVKDPNRIIKILPTKGSGLNNSYSPANKNGRAGGLEDDLMSSEFGSAPLSPKPWP